MLAGRSNQKAHLRDPAGWAKQALNPNRGRLGAEIGKRGVVMFPTSHGITPTFLPQSLQTIRNLIARDNRVLVVSIKEVIDRAQNGKILKPEVVPPTLTAAQVMELERLEAAGDRGVEATIAQDADTAGPEGTAGGRRGPAQGRGNRPAAGRDRGADMKAAGSRIVLRQRRIIAVSFSAKRLPSRFSPSARPSSS